MVERSAVNRLVVGSNPTSGATAHLTVIRFMRSSMALDPGATLLRLSRAKNLEGRHFRLPGPGARAGTPEPQCGTVVLPSDLRKTAWKLAKLQRASLATPSSA